MTIVSRPAPIDETAVLRFDGSGGLAHAPGLDGMRGIAVLAVVVYHLAPSWMPGGFLGVEMFFVLSGFLITSLLLSELDASGTVRISGFLLRRARRLLPAMFAAVVVICVLSTILLPDIERARTRAHALSVLTYSINWKLVGEGLSYTDLVSGESPFRHMWSLAIEEQFYLVVAGLLGVGALLGWRDRPRLRRHLMVGASVLALVSTCLMWLLAADPRRSNARVYYGTDTRAAGLLVGVALAAAVADRSIRRIPPAWLTAIGTTGWMVLAIALWRATESSSTMYRGGLAVVSLATAAAIVGLQQRSAVTRVLEQRHLRAVGRMSYGIYVWHWPAIIFITGTRTGWSPWAVGAARVVAIAVASIVSFRFVERPFRRGVMPWNLRIDLFLPIGLVVALVAAVATTRPPPVVARSTPVAGATPADTEVGSQRPLDAAAPAVSTVDGDVVGVTVMPPVEGTSTTVKDVIGVAILGDSVAHTVAGGEVGAFPDFVRWTPDVSSFTDLPVRVHSLARPGCSFLPGEVARVRADGSWDSVSLAEFCGDWRGDLAASLAGPAPVDEVALVLSNDLEDRAVDGELVRFGSPEFEPMLTALLDEMVGLTEPAGARLVLVATPPRSDPPDTDAGGWREVRMRELLVAYAAGRSNALFLDVGELVCPADDCSAPAHGFERGWRYDGLHYDREGARCVAAWLTARLTLPADSDLPPTWSCPTAG